MALRALIRFELTGRRAALGLATRTAYSATKAGMLGMARTWALVIAATIFYIPANVLPMTVTTSLGTTQADTIMSGVIYFIHSGSWEIAAIIFIASVFVPLLKLLILVVLSVFFVTAAKFLLAYVEKLAVREGRITESRR